MLRDLEERLATVLGADLPAPLAGRIRVRPGSPNGSQPSAQITVRAVTPVTPDFGAIRPEVAPGDPAARRIVRLHARIDIHLSAGGGSARANRARALDDLVYFLDAPGMRSGQALRDVGDPGFLLDRLTIDAANYEPSLDDPEGPDLTLSAVGWFWPVGEAGVDGPAIAEARIAQIVYPIGHSPDPARFVAGGDVAEISLAFTDVQLLARRADGPGTSDTLRLAFELLAADGSAGQGSLTNGRALGGGIRSRTFEDGTVTIRYQPPAQPGMDRLIVRLVQEGDETRFGPVLLELPLITEAPA